jgi:hypothetical protein
MKIPMKIQTRLTIPEPGQFFTCKAASAAEPERIAHGWL